MGYDVQLGMGGTQGGEETGVRWSILQGEGEEARSPDSVLAWNGGFTCSPGTAAEFQDIHHETCPQ